MAATTHIHVHVQYLYSICTKYRPIPFVLLAKVLAHIMYMYMYVHVLHTARTVSKNVYGLHTVFIPNMYTYM